MNPDHLFLGTHQDNTDDMLAKGRHRMRSDGKPKGAKVTEEIVRDIRSRYARREATQRDLAAEHGISTRQVWMIIARRSWAHVD